LEGGIPLQGYAIHEKHLKRGTYQRLGKEDGAKRKHNVAGKVGEKICEARKEWGRPDQQYLENKKEKEAVQKHKAYPHNMANKKGKKKSCEKRRVNKTGKPPKKVQWGNVNIKKEKETMKDGTISLTKQTT